MGVIQFTCTHADTVQIQEREKPNTSPTFGRNFHFLYILLWQRKVMILCGGCRSLIQEDGLSRLKYINTSEGRFLTRTLKINHTVSHKKQDLAFSQLCCLE